MSQNLMDTEIGGEQTQYEGTHTFVDPHAKLGGQFGGPATTMADATQHKIASNVPNTLGVTPADKIRYGQSIQEGGMGGKTAGMAGVAVSAGGFGGTDALREEEDEFTKVRREQGYGNETDMAKDIGA